MVLIVYTTLCILLYLIGTDSDLTLSYLIFSNQLLTLAIKSNIIQSLLNFITILTNFRPTNQNNLPCLSGPKLQCDFLFVIFEHNMKVSILLEMYFQLKCRRSLDISREIL